METLIHDLKHALRMLRQSPGFTATAISALALGIGANTAIFSVVNAVLLKPLPFPEPDRIVPLMNSSPQGTFPGACVPKYNVWRAQTQVLEDVAAYDTGGPGLNLSGGDRPEQLKGIHVSHEFFHLFGAPVALGPHLHRRGRPARAAATSWCSRNGLWQRRFGSDPAIVGKSIRLGGEPYTVIGVLGPGFAFDPPPDVYLPFQADPNSTNQGHFFQAAARLKPGVSLERRQSRARRWPPRNSSAVSRTPWARNSSFTAEPMQQLMVRNVRTALYSSCWARSAACC